MLPRGQLPIRRLPCQASWHLALLLTLKTSETHSLLASGSNKHKLPRARYFLCFEDTAITEKPVFFNDTTLQSWMWAAAERGCVALGKAMSLSQGKYYKGLRVEGICPRPSQQVKEYSSSVLKEDLGNDHSLQSFLHPTWIHYFKFWKHLFYSGVSLVGGKILPRET